MTALTLDENQIADVSALGNLTKIFWLGLRDNAVTNVDALENHMDLKYLYLGGNRICAPLSPAVIALQDEHLNSEDTWIKLEVNGLDAQSCP